MVVPPGKGQMRPADVAEAIRRTKPAAEASATKKVAQKAAASDDGTGLDTNRFDALDEVLSGGGGSVNPSNSDTVAQDLDAYLAARDQASLSTPGSAADGGPSPRLSVGDFPANTPPRLERYEPDTETTDDGIDGPSRTVGGDAAMGANVTDPLADMASRGRDLTHSDVLDGYVAEHLAAGDRTAPGVDDSVAGSATDHDESRGYGSGMFAEGGKQRSGTIESTGGPGWVALVNEDGEVLGGGSAKGGWLDDFPRLKEIVDKAKAAMMFNANTADELTRDNQATGSNGSGSTSGSSQSGSIDSSTYNWSGADPTGKLSEGYNADGSYTVVYSDGTSITTYPGDHRQEIHHPDGSKDIYYEDGTHVTVGPDGSQSGSGESSGEQVAGGGAGEAEGESAEEGDGEPESDGEGGSAGSSNPLDPADTLPKWLRDSIDAEVDALRGHRAPTGDGNIDPGRDDSALAYGRNRAFDAKELLVGPGRVDMPSISGQGDIGDGSVRPDRGAIDPDPMSAETPAATGPEERDGSKSIDGYRLALPGDDVDDDDDGDDGDGTNIVPVSEIDHSLSVMDPVHSSFHEHFDGLHGGPLDLDHGPLDLDDDTPDDPDDGE